MEITNKQLTIAAAALAVCAVTSIFVSTCSRQKSVAQKEAVAPVTDEAAPAAGKQEKKSTLTPVRPEDYGMIVINERTRPQTQEGWDVLMARKVHTAVAELPEEKLAKLKAKMAEDPAKTREKLKLIDDKIAKCQEMLKSDPKNQECKDAIERLMMLKSIYKSVQ